MRSLGVCAAPVPLSVGTLGGLGIMRRWGDLAQLVAERDPLAPTLPLTQPGTAQSGRTAWSTASTAGVESRVDECDLQLACYVCFATRQRHAKPPEGINGTAVRSRWCNQGLERRTGLRMTVTLLFQMRMASRKSADGRICSTCTLSFHSSWSLKTIFPACSRRPSFATGGARSRGAVRGVREHEGTHRQLRRHVHRFNACVQEGTVKGMHPSATMR